MACMITNYKEDCEYLRKKFDLHDSVSIYELVNKATTFIKEVDDIAELDKLNTLEKEKEQCQKKKVSKSKSKKKKLLKK